VNAGDPELCDWLAEAARWADAELERRVPPQGTEPARLHAAMRHVLEAGGKRLRPALVRLVCTELGGELADAAAPAVAVELVHSYSLVHDDLPCMDDDDLRRGKPTVHVAYDEATAVLAGDALLTLAFEVLGGARHAGDSVRVLARAAGSRGMVGGQVLDLFPTGDEGGALAAVTELHARKTGDLIGAAAELGAVAAGASADARAAARAYGSALGLCFQAVDDLLDVTGDAGTLGKTPGKDAALERSTLVAAVGLEAARVRAAALADDAREAARALGWGPGALGVRLVERILDRSR
jgi:farnesyl diphosphate synthase